MKKINVFLGGTCNGSTWRDQLAEMLVPEVNAFNPVVPVWDEAAQQREREEREGCDYCLYVITPKMVGVYSIAEAVDDSHKRPGKLICCYLDSDGDAAFTPHQFASIKQTAQLIGRNIQAHGGKTFVTLEQVAFYLNSLTGAYDKNTSPTTSMWDDLVSTWKDAYEYAYRTPKRFKDRLQELKTWDTCNNGTERAAKIEALEQLIGKK